MLMNFALVAAGLLLLVVAGDMLVRGAVALSLKLGIPALIVSLTVVAFGTSAPELLVAVQSALEGAPGIAFGNVVGSNIANVLLVLGVPALISGIQTDKTDSQRALWIMIGVSLLFVGLCFFGQFYIIHGVILLATLTWFLVDMVRSGKDDGSDVDDMAVHMSGKRVALLTVLGLVGLPLGAHFLIDGAVGIAEAWGMSEAVIGLTIVAVGTSLPELATSVTAAFKRQADVALGNVIGSNVFNILGIMGIASFFGPLQVPREMLSLDLWVMMASALVLVPFVIKGIAISRGMGLAFVMLYGVYVTALIL